MCVMSFFGIWIIIFIKLWVLSCKIFCLVWMFLKFLINIFVIVFVNGVCNLLLFKFVLVIFNVDFVICLLVRVWFNLDWLVIEWLKSFCICLSWDFVSLKCVLCLLYCSWKFLGLSLVSSCFFLICWLVSVGNLSNLLFILKVRYEFWLVIILVGKLCIVLFERLFIVNNFIGCIIGLILVLDVCLEYVVSIKIRFVVIVMNVNFIVFFIDMMYKLVVGYVVNI